MVSKKLIGLAVAAMMVIAIIPAASAVDFAFNSKVVAGDWEAVYAPAAVAFTDIEYWDLNGNGAFNAGEPVYLMQTTLVPAINDVLLTAYDGKAAGTQITASDAVIGKTPTVLAGATWAYLDVLGDGYTADDKIYIDTNADGIVSAGDLKADGTRVVSGSSDEGAPLVATTAGLPDIFLDVDGDGLYGNGDIIYLDEDALGTVTINDVRAIKTTNFAFNSKVVAGDWEAVYAPAAVVFAGIDYWDLNGNGAFNAGEPVYLVVALTAPAINDVLLTAYGGKAAGTQITASDAVIGKVTVNLVAACWCYLDVLGDGYTADDKIFIDITTPGFVSAGDLKADGTRVVSGSSDEGAPLVATTAGLPDIFLDVDGDGLYGNGDIIYLDEDALGTVTINDVRGVKSSGGAVTPPVTPPGDDDDDDTVPPVGDDDDDDTTPVTPPKKTPGFEAVAIIGALGVAMVLLRRRK